MCCVGAHQVHEVQGEYVDTASHSGQRTNDGGENAETTRTEQEVLHKTGIHKKLNSSIFLVIHLLYNI